MAAPYTGWPFSRGGVMDTRAIGSLEVSVVGLGCNNFGGRIDADATDAVVGAALDAGVNFFDTADLYGGGHSEELLGHALGARRDEVVVATKFGMAYKGGEGGARPDYVRRCADISLKRLGTDRIDLYQLHAPDDTTPIADTLGALDELVGQGKVREIGCSNFSAAQLAESARAAGEGARFVSVQNHYSLLHRQPEDGVLEECDRLGIAFLPFYPLANGLLTGKYRPGQPAPEGTRIAAFPAERAGTLLSEANLATVAALDELARSEGGSVLDLAFAWLLGRPEVASVIAGATRPEQVRSNVATVSWHPSAELLARVEEILVGG